MINTFSKIFFAASHPNQLLSVLFSETKQSEKAWEEFLRRYSKLILKILWLHEKDHDKVMEMYVHVCMKLSENNFRLLKNYRTDFSDISPKLSTWLTTVVNNMCTDIYRKNNGQKRLPKAIKDLPEDDKQFFKFYYWERLPLQEISDIMDLNSDRRKENSPDKLRRIESLLTRTPKQRERINILPYDDETFIAQADENKSLQMHDDSYEINAKIINLIEELSPLEKIIIKLRFWENLSVKEIAEVVNITPYRKVYSILEKTLTALKEKVEHE